MLEYYLMLYSNPILLFGVTLVLAVMFLHLLYSFSDKLGLIDMPGGRKKHGGKVPLVGGLAIFIVITCILFPYFIQKTQYLAFWTASLLLVFVCTLDDMKSIQVNHRFLIQFISIIVLALFGQAIIYDLGDLIGLGNIHLGVFAIPFTIFALIGVINAVNMMDGIDGITGCISLVEFSFLGVLAVIVDAKFEFTVIIVFISAICAFLLFNFPSKFFLKKRTFLGDTGSMLIGLTLAWLTVRLTQGENKISPILMLWLLAVPLMDTIHLIINRKLRGVSAFKADRRHIHHILLQLSYSPLQISLILMLVAFIIGGIGIFLFVNQASDRVLFLGFVLIFCLYLRASYLLKKRVANRKIKIWRPRVC